MISIYVATEICSLVYILLLSGSSFCVYVLGLYTIVQLQDEQLSFPCSFDVLLCAGSCADIMHSAQPFRNGFQEAVIAVILKDIVSGLDYLHSLGFVHR